MAKAEGKAEGSGSGGNTQLQWIVFLNVALYATCYQLQRPVEPFMIEKLSKADGQSAAEGLASYAKLQSFFSALQMVGSIVVGRLLDRLGPRTMFLVTFVASALSYYLLSQATTIEILYYSKLPTIFQAGFLCAQTTMSQITSDGTERVTALGRLTMAYTVGTVVGPAVGGYLGSTGDYYYGATLACYGSLLSCLLTLMLPAAGAHSASAPSPSSSSPSSSSSSLSTSNSKIPLFLHRLIPASVVSVVVSVGGLLGLKFVSSTANAMREATMPLVLKNSFAMREQDLGLTYSGFSALNAVINGLLLQPISKYFDGNLLTVIHVCLGFCLSACILQAICAQPWIEASSIYNSGQGEYLLTTFIWTISSFVMSTMSTSESTSRVDKDFRGTLLGIEHSLFAAARVAAPTAGVAILRDHGPSGVAMAAASFFSMILFGWHSFPSFGPPTTHAARLTDDKDEGERKER
jgi:predicted MFS family arabinose efflux permease